MEDPCGTNESTDPKFGNGPSENDNGGKKKRREQNRVAQKRYREKLAEKAKQTDWLAKQATAFWHNLLEARQSGSLECPHCQRLGLFSLPSPSIHFATPPRTNSGTSSMENITIPNHVVSSNTPTQTPNAVDMGSIVNKTSPIFLSNSAGTEYMNRDSMQKDMHPISTPNDNAAGLHEPCAEWNSGQLNDGTPLLQDLYELADDIVDLTKENVRDDTLLKIKTPHKRTLSQLDASLHAAASQGNKEIVSILLRNGSIIDAQDDLGRTPLRLCAENGHVEVLKLLMDQGADPTTTDDEGTSILLAAPYIRGEKKL